MVGRVRKPDSAFVRDWSSSFGQPWTWKGLGGFRTNRHVLATFPKPPVGGLVQIVLPTSHRPTTDHWRPGLKALLASVIINFFSLFFQSEHRFSLTTNQSKQCFGLFFQRNERGHICYKRKCTLNLQDYKWTIQGTKANHAFITLSNPSWRKGTKRMASHWTTHKAY